MSGYTEEELANLTQAERDALLGDEDQGEIEGKNPGVTDEAAGNNEGDGDGNETEDGQDRNDDAADSSGGDAGNGDDAPAGDADAGNGGGQDDADQQDQPQAPPPVFVAEAPADAQEKLDAIKTSKEELLAKFDDGDITTAEYHKELDALNKQEREIELAVHEAKLAEKMAMQQARNEFLNTAKHFTSQTHPEYAKNADLYNKLDQTVRELANMPSMANATGLQILERAHALVKIDNPDAFKEAAGSDEPAKPPKTPAKAPNLPPNLSKVPNADMNDTNGGEFAALDRLANSGDVEAYEAAIAKLPPAKLESYLQR